MLDVIIFSKDRACQLELLLGSIKRFFGPWRDCNVHVIYTHSTAAFARGYSLVRAEHPEFSYVCERTTPLGFRDLTLALIGHHPYLTFFVDDDVLKAPFSLHSAPVQTFMARPEVMCLSLRMYPGIHYSYTTDRPVSAPPLEDGVWDWGPCHGDWGYPMSVEGHLFRSEEIVPLIERLEFFDPNSFEATLAHHPLANPKMICFEQSRLVNIPVNRVQDTAPNRHGDVAAEWLNEQFLAGRRLSLDTVIGARTPSPHYELPLVWEAAGRPPAGTPPRVSVVVEATHRGPELEAALESVVAQSVEVETVLVDTRAGAKLGIDPVRDAVELAQGEYVVFVRPGDEVGPGWARLCMDALDAEPAAAFAYGSPSDAANPYDFDALTRRNLTTRAAMYRLSAWRDGGGLDLDTDHARWDTWLRLGEQGHGGVSVAGAAWSRVAPSSAEVPDRLSRALIVQAHPKLYSPGQLAWARAVMAGDRWVDGVPEEDGVIPDVAVDVDGAAVAVGPPVRRFVTVASAAEIVQRPQLLSAYATRFGGGDDATLVLYAPEGGPADLLSRVVSAVVSAGLDAAGGPDMQALSVPAADGDAVLLRTADAVLSDEDAGGPAVLSGLCPRFESSAVDALHAMFTARCPAC